MASVAAEPYGYVKIKSGRTGKRYRVWFRDEPTDDDIDEVTGIADSEGWDEYTEAPAADPKPEASPAKGSKDPTVFYGQQYEYGGKNPDSGKLDCSGYACAVAKRLGIDVPSGSSGMLADKRTKPYAGKLDGPAIIVRSSKASPSGRHVGVFIDGKIYDAAGEGKPVGAAHDPDEWMSGGKVLGVLPLSKGQVQSPAAPKKNAAAATTGPRISTGLPWEGQEPGFIDRYATDPFGTTEQLSKELGAQPIKEGPPARFEAPASRLSRGRKLINLRAAHASRANKLALDKERLLRELNQLNENDRGAQKKITAINDIDDTLARIDVEQKRITKELGELPSGHNLAAGLPPLSNATFADYEKRHADASQHANELAGRVKRAQAIYNKTPNEINRAKLTRANDAYKETIGIVDKLEANMRTWREQTPAGDTIAEHYGERQQRLASDADLKQRRERFAKMGILEKAGNALSQGFGGAIEGGVSAAAWAMERVGLHDSAELTRGASNILSEDVRKFSNPDAALWEQVVSGIGSQAPFWMAGFGTGALVSKIAPRAAAWLGAGVSATTEASTNAGSTYSELIRGGMSEGEASQRAGMQFASEIVPNIILEKLGLFSEGRGIKAAFAKSTPEAFQEGYQQAIQNIAEGRPWDEGVMDSSLVGGLTALVFAVPVGVHQSREDGREARITQRAAVRSVAERLNVAVPEAPPSAKTEKPAVEKSAVKETSPAAPIAKTETKIEDSQGRGFTETRVDPKTIGVLPGLQFKTSEVTDEKNAVSDLLKGAAKYDQAAAGPLTVWQKEDGDLYVVNGHHRRELAIRTNQESVPVRIYSEASGVDFETARALGAMQNLMDGKGRPLDVATALQRGLIDEDTMRESGIPMTQNLVKDALGLMKLSEDSLDMVRNGEVNDSVAGAIGSAKLSPERQLAALREAKRSGIETRRQGEILAEKTKNAKLAKRGEDDGQGDIFGGLDEDLAFGEATIIEDAVERTLTKDKRLFDAVARGKAAEGTTINKEAQSAEATAAGFARQIIGTSAKVQQAIEEAAVSYARNPSRKRLNEITEHISKIARREAERITSGFSSKADEGSKAVRESLQSDDRRGEGERPRRSDDSRPRSKRRKPRSSERDETSETLASKSLSEAVQSEYAREYSRMQVTPHTVKSKDLPHVVASIAHVSGAYDVTIYDESKPRSRGRDIGRAATVEEAQELARQRLAPIIRAGSIEAAEAAEPSESRMSVESARQAAEDENGKTTWLAVGDTHAWTGTGYTPMAEAKRRAAEGDIKLEPFIKARHQGTMFENQPALFSKIFDEAAAAASGPAPSRGQAFSNSKGLSKEEFAAHIDQIVKVAKSGGTNVFLEDIDFLSGNAGEFINPTKKFRHGRIRTREMLPPGTLAEVLSHEVGHQIDSVISTSTINPKTEKPYTGATGNFEVLFGTDKETAKTIEEELSRLTIFLEGTEAVAANQTYYASKKELYARFMQCVMFHPGLVEEHAKVSFDRLVAMSKEHPEIADFLSVAEGGMLEYDAGFMFLPDARQTYIKQLGRYLGTKAYNNEVIYRAQRARALAETTKLVSEKMKGVKDKEELLFDAAEGIKVTAAGVPEFGTKVRVSIPLPEGMTPEEFDAIAAGMIPASLDNKDVKRFIEDYQAQKAAGFTVVALDEDGNVLFEKWRKTPDEAKMAYNALSEEGKAAIREYTADVAEATDNFNRELQKKMYDIESDIEGYVHHFGFDKDKKNRQLNTWRKLFLVERKASAQKRRTGREGYTKDFRRAVSKAMAELQIAREYNKFVNRQLALVAKPLAEGAHPEAGWHEVSGNLISGVDVPGSRTLIVDGIKLKPGKRYQVPQQVYETYLKGRAFTDELNTAREIVERLNRYWQANMLMHTGTATTNFVSGALQYGGKMSTDFWLDALEGDMTHTRANIVALFETVTPAGWRRAPDWVFGGDQTNFYAQFKADENSGTPAPDEIMNKLMTGYMGIERFWKKVIVNSEQRASGLENPFDDKEFLAHVNEVVDAFAYDYANVPLWLSTLRRHPVGAAVKPFATYPYKYLKMLTNMAGGAFDKNLSPKERVAKFMGLATVLTALSMLRKLRDDDDQEVGKLSSDVAETIDEAEIEGTVNPRGRMFVGRDSDGSEVFLRTAKYPFLDILDFGRAAANIDTKGMLDILKDKIGTIGPAAEGALNLMGWSDEFSKYQPLGTKFTSLAAEFIPGSRLLKDGQELIDPHTRKMPMTAGEVIGQYIPFMPDDLPTWLSRPVKTVKIPLEPGEKAGSRTTETVEVPKHWEDVMSKMFFGVILKRINPDWYRRTVSRKVELAKKKAAKDAGETTTPPRRRAADPLGLGSSSGP